VTFRCIAIIPQTVYIFDTHRETRTPTHTLLGVLR
jgi:hypothetical protein